MENRKKLYILWEGVKSSERGGRTGKTIVGAFGSLNELITHVQSSVRDKFWPGSGRCVRIPASSEFVVGLDIPWGHEVRENVDYYYRFEMCEMM